MTFLLVEERVFVFAHWHSRCGERGTVTRVNPLWVRFDGDSHPMTCEERAVVSDDERPTEPNMSGAE